MNLAIAASPLPDTMWPQVTDHLTALQPILWPRLVQVFLPYRQTGPAYWAHLWATERGFKTNRIRNKGFDTASIVIQNSTLVTDVDAILIYWNGESPGVKDLIKKALVCRLDMHLIYCRY